jgi:hypothetical protein
MHGNHHHHHHRRDSHHAQPPAPPAATYPPPLCPPPPPVALAWRPKFRSISLADQKAGAFPAAYAAEAAEAEHETQDEFSPCEI